jgi:hypothetical protein
VLSRVPLRETALGPIFVELRLTDTHGRNLAERVDVQVAELNRVSGLCE